MNDDQTSGDQARTQHQPEPTAAQTSAPVEPVAPSEPTTPLPAAEPTATIPAVDPTVSYPPVPPAAESPWAAPYAGDATPAAPTYAAPAPSPYTPQPYPQPTYAQQPYGQQPTGPQPTGPQPTGPDPYAQPHGTQPVYGQPSHEQQPYGQQPYGQQPYAQPVYGQAGGTPPPPPGPGGSFHQPGLPPQPRSGSHWHQSLALRFGAAALVVGLAAGGIGGAVIARATQATASDQSTTSTVQLPGTQQQGGSSSEGGTSGGTGQGQQNPWSGGFGFPDQGSGGTSGQSGTSTGTDYSAASTDQKVGVVTITSVLGYESAESAGTGMILTSDGEILTNNHVINGATKITVTVESTNKSYTAKVVGTDATNDVAVLQLENASGLSTVDLDTSAVATGDKVTAIGNAEGTGDLVAADGSVTATGQQITTSSEYGTAGETLDNLIQIDADVVSGDSGGPLVDSDGQVVGITTAASTGGSNISGFAIPIADAIKIVDQIEAGTESGTVQIGLPAFLGVQLSTSASTGTTSGAVLGGVVANTPAADAGLAAGDTITKVDGTTISSADDLSSYFAKKNPGDKVKITWTDSSGSSHSKTVTLIEGPAA